MITVGNRPIAGNISFKMQDRIFYTDRSVVNGIEYYTIRLADGEDFSMSSMSRVAVLFEETNTTVAPRLKWAGRDPDEKIIVRYNGEPLQQEDIHLNAMLELYLLYHGDTTVRITTLTNNYAMLFAKPLIGGVEVVGSKTLSSYGLDTELPNALTIQNILSQLTTLQGRGVIYANVGTSTVMTTNQINEVWSNATGTAPSLGAKIINSAGGNANATLYHNSFVYVEQYGGVKSWLNMGVDAIGKATASTLGTVKGGGNVIISSDGALSVNLVPYQLKSDVIVYGADGETINKNGNTFSIKPQNVNIVNDNTTFSSGSVTYPNFVRYTMNKVNALFANKGDVKTVNSQSPDVNGNVSLLISNINYNGSTTFLNWLKSNYAEYGSAGTFTASKNFTGGLTVNSVNVATVNQVVRYDTTQWLTDAQKKTARQNIDVDNIFDGDYDNLTNVPIVINALANVESINDILNSKLNQNVKKGVFGSTGVWLSDVQLEASTILVISQIINAINSESLVLSQSQLNSLKQIKYLFVKNDDGFVYTDLNVMANDFSMSYYNRVNDNIYYGYALFKTSNASGTFNYVVNKTSGKTIQDELEDYIELINERPVVLQADTSNFKLSDPYVKNRGLGYAALDQIQVNSFLFTVLEVDAVDGGIVKLLASDKETVYNYNPAGEFSATGGSGSGAVIEIRTRYSEGAVVTRGRLSLANEYDPLVQESFVAGSIFNHNKHAAAHGDIRALISAIDVNSFQAKQAGARVGGRVATINADKSAEETSITIDNVNTSLSYTQNISSKLKNISEALHIDTDLRLDGYIYRYSNYNSISNKIKYVATTFDGARIDKIIIGDGSGGDYAPNLVLDGKQIYKQMVSDNTVVASLLDVSNKAPSSLSYNEQTGLLTQMLGDGTIVQTVLPTASELSTMRYLAVWYANTGVTATVPGGGTPGVGLENYYLLKAGDILGISNVSETTNYSPIGSTVLATESTGHGTTAGNYYFTGITSAVLENGVVANGDEYRFDGSSWSLQHNNFNITTPAQNNSFGVVKGNVINHAIIDGLIEHADGSINLAKLATAVQTSINSVVNKVDTSTFTAHTGDAGVHVSSALQTAWNAKYDKPSTGIPYIDLAEDIRSILDAVGDIPELSINVSGTGNVLTGLEYSNGVFTVTKGNALASLSIATPQGLGNAIASLSYSNGIITPTLVQTLTSIPDDSVTDVKIGTRAVNTGSSSAVPGIEAKTYTEWLQAIRNYLVNFDSIAAKIDGEVLSFDTLTSYRKGTLKVFSNELYYAASDTSPAANPAMPDKGWVKIALYPNLSDGGTGTTYPVQAPSSGSVAQSRNTQISFLNGEVYDKRGKLAAISDLGSLEKLFVGNIQVPDDDDFVMAAASATYEGESLQDLDLGMGIEFNALLLPILTLMINDGQPVTLPVASWKVIFNNKVTSLFVDLGQGKTLTCSKINYFVADNESNTFKAIYNMSVVMPDNSPTLASIQVVAIGNGDGTATGTIYIQEGGSNGGSSNEGSSNEGNSADEWQVIPRELPENTQYLKLFSLSNSFSRRLTFEMQSMHSKFYAKFEINLDPNKNNASAQLIEKWGNYPANFELGIAYNSNDETNTIPVLVLYCQNYIGDDGDLRGIMYKVNCPITDGSYDNNLAGGVAETLFVSSNDVTTNADAITLYNNVVSLNSRFETIEQQLEGLEARLELI